MSKKRHQAGGGDRPETRLCGTTRELTIDGITVKTNLTEADLENPRLWTMRTPAAWARWIKYHQGGGRDAEAEPQSVVREDR